MKPLFSLTLLFCLAVSFFPAQAETILSRIETFQAPTYPVEGYFRKETYDYRKSTGLPVPKTLALTLIRDIVQKTTLDAKPKAIDPKTLTAAEIRATLNAYHQGDWEKMGGYRPWTHWQFIQKLSPTELDQLASEITDYLHQLGPTVAFDED